MELRPAPVERRAGRPDLEVLHLVDPRERHQRQAVGHPPVDRDLGAGGPDVVLACGSTRTRPPARRATTSEDQDARHQRADEAAAGRRERVVAGLVGPAARSRRGRGGARRGGRRVMTVSSCSAARPGPGRLHGRGRRQDAGRAASAASAEASVRPVGLHDVGHEHGDVVDAALAASAAATSAASASSRSGSGQQLGDLGVVDQPAEPVAAEQQPVPGASSSRVRPRRRRRAGR